MAALTTGWRDKLHLELSQFFHSGRPVEGGSLLIVNPQASSSLAYVRVWRTSAIASLPLFLSTRAASRSALVRSLRRAHYESPAS